MEGKRSEEKGRRKHPQRSNIERSFFLSVFLLRSIAGKKIMALAVTEPWAGSDVANIKTTARREVKKKL